VITASEQLHTYLESFTELENRLAREPRWLRNLREEGFAGFSEAGFPTTHDEDWRFTNVSSLAATPFQLAAPEKVRAGEVERFKVSGFAARLVFVNGRFAPEISTVPPLARPIRVSSLAEEIAANPAGLEPHLGRYLNTQRDAFCALNAAFFEDGAYLRIGKGGVLESPVHLLFVTTAGDRPVMTHSRNLIVVEQEAQATLVEEYVSLGEQPAFSNTATELVAGENAVVSHYMIEREHRQAFNFSTLRIQLGRSANVASHSLLLGGGLVRNNVHPVLAGEGAECLINGLFIGSGRQHMDNYMLVEHQSPHCASRQFYNGILDRQAHGVFHGRIIVHPDAQKTDAKQTNRNLLLSDDARIDTKPQLEIYADDVKCTHGATIGQIDEDALFYLRSRGIDEASARRVLVMAFANECLDRMSGSAAREHVEQLVGRHLLELADNGSPAVHSGRRDRGRNFEEVG